MTGRVRNPESDAEDHPFNICRSETVGPVTLKKSLLELNQEKRKEIQRSQNPPQHAYLRSGMILLKNYISHHDQVKIVEKCRDLGISSGGFYRPCYKDGAKLRLYMMCLGKNWDPEARLYEDNRPIDGAKAPEIPEYLRKLVDRAIQASHDFLRQNYKDVNIEDEVPNMSPDICIVNFYNNSGKLGLHQDRDESKKSLHRGLPVVSFSLGDSAEFLYGVERDADNAEKVVLESGDVLMFGGNSRLIYHGVSCIHPNTAPKGLIKETKLRPGRLNLTFRQY
ncbi:alpha-ketoglutarate-dependent dioxygenase abh1 [Cocos nucifera]|uniref:DNA N(6)-methyladenine demethylase n=1 Tax=Cocos nucifera TaxID=13894 RepID=A0A8K0N185_COCNU|nr:alpha-ketoglutarate-dependent dioxygenase abh1 [Cocos nucifera]